MNRPVKQNTQERRNDQKKPGAPSVRASCRDVPWKMRGLACPALQSSKSLDCRHSVIPEFLQSGRALQCLTSPNGPQTSDQCSGQWLELVNWLEVESGMKGENPSADGTAGWGAYDPVGALIQGEAGLKDTSVSSPTWNQPAHLLVLRAWVKGMVLSGLNGTCPLLHSHNSGLVSAILIQLTFTMLSTLSSPLWVKCKMDRWVWKGELALPSASGIGWGGTEQCVLFCFDFGFCLILSGNLERL